MLVFLLEKFLYVGTLKILVDIAVISNQKAHPFVFLLTVLRIQVLHPLVNITYYQSFKFWHLETQKWYLVFKFTLL